MNTLRQQVAIVTAPVDGIGAECARAMAAAGARIALADTRDGTVLAREIEANGGRAMVLKADLTDEAAALAMTQTVVDHYGQIDILINCLPWRAPAKASFSEIPLGDWDRMVGDALRGIFVCVKAVVPYIRRSTCGRIINVCPTVDGGSTGELHLATARGAILAFTHSLARDLSLEGIGVSVLANAADLHVAVAEPAQARPTSCAVH